MRDSRKRSLVKTISWRVTGTLSTFVISYAITGNILLAGTISSVQLIANTVLYYFHERAWSSTKWGQQ